MSYFFSILLIAFGAFALKTDTTQIQAWVILVMGIIWLAKSLSSKVKHKNKPNSGSYSSSAADYKLCGSDSSGVGD